MTAEVRFELPKAAVTLERIKPDGLMVRLAGNWRISGHPPGAAAVETQLRGMADVHRLGYDAAAVTDWDSGLLAFLVRTSTAATAAKIAVDFGGLPSGVQQLLKLAAAVPERAGARRGTTVQPILDQIGKATQALGRQSGEMVAFIGETVVGFGHLIRGKARFRMVDALILAQECGAQALGIVSLISVLVGLILAFVGSVQLKQFGAQIFVANLVGVGTAREMGALMTAIIMAGRTGAAFAAQLGTMEVNEEIDALKTFGFSPIDFLVMPRMMALIIMMPFLCVYSDLLGIFGGGIVGVTMLDISLVQYVNQTLGALTLTDFLIGIVKSAVFGILIALSGCLRGMQCGRSASAVGAAATSAVVTSIVLIVVADGLFSVLLDILGI
ncbi:MAG TPA: ABC transporter permease [Alphaproteobacteria bacterium]|nr:ABC transporter permease [Alphaproteobacteria bacterium]